MVAPELIDAEVMHALRRRWLFGLIPLSAAQAGLDRLASWHLRRLSHRPLIELAWKYRHNVSAYDALYVAAAEALAIPLLTADGPLTRAPTPLIEIENLADPGWNGEIGA